MYAVPRQMYFLDVLCSTHVYLEYYTGWLMLHLYYLHLSLYAVENGFCFLQFNLLIPSSGDNMKSSVKLVMSRLFDNYAMSFINLDGRGQSVDGRGRKLAMRNTPLCRVITGMSIHAIFVIFT